MTASTPFQSSNQTSFAWLVNDYIEGLNRARFERFIVGKKQLEQRSVYVANAVIYYRCESSKNAQLIRSLDIPINPHLSDYYIYIYIYLFI